MVSPLRESHCYHIRWLPRCDVRRDSSSRLTRGLGRFITTSTRTPSPAHPCSSVNLLAGSVRAWRVSVGSARSGRPDEDRGGHGGMHHVELRELEPFQMYRAVPSFQGSSSCSGCRMQSSFLESCRDRGPAFRGVFQCETGPGLPRSDRQSQI